MAGGRGALFSCDPDVTVTASWFDPQFWTDRRAMLSKARGRGTAHVFGFEGRRFVLRHYRRGGMVAKLRGDRYWWLGEGATRPWREILLTHRMHTEGLPVPQPVAAVYQREGASYRGDLITLQISNTETLAQRLKQAPLSLIGWAAIGRCIKRFHERGICHADLNAHNVLLRGDDEVFLIDFDRARIRRRGQWQDSNLTRLRRSLEKLGDERGRAQFETSDWYCLLSAYF